MRILWANRTVYIVDHTSGQALSSFITPTWNNPIGLRVGEQYYGLRGSCYTIPGRSNGIPFMWEPFPGVANL